MLTSLRQVALCVPILVAYLTIVVADVEQKTEGDAVKHDNNNAVVQPSLDLTALSKFTTRSVYNFGVNS